jgi:hypothetical protein
MERKWSQIEIEYLIENYPFGDKEKIKEALNRSWSSIQNKAFLLKIKRNKLNANSIKLTNETNEAYYWLGFIMADGHFSLANNQIQINLGYKDIEHLKRFAKFVEYNGEIIKPKISIGFGDIKTYLENKFEISNNKTYVPCTLKHLSGDSFFSFIIGFIDGDGTIDTKGYLKLKCHKSWLHNLNEMVKFLSDNDFNCGIINSEGLAYVSLTKIEMMKKIKIKIINLGLPVLKRKWDRVNFNKFSKTQRTLKNMNECRELFSKGLSVREVIKITGLSKSQVYKQKQLILKVGQSY